MATYENIEFRCEDMQRLPEGIATNDRWITVDDKEIWSSPVYTFLTTEQLKHLKLSFELSRAMMEGGEKFTPLTLKVYSNGKEITNSII